LLLLQRETQISLDTRNARVQLSGNLVCGQFDAVRMVTRDNLTRECTATNQGSRYHTTFTNDETFLMAFFQSTKTKHYEPLARTRSRNTISSTCR
jgi:hypothetical protein